LYNFIEEIFLDPCIPSNKVKTFKITDDFLFAVLENTPFGIIAFNQKGRIQWTNAQLINFLQIKPGEKEIIGRNITDIIHEPYELIGRIRGILNGDHQSFDLEGLFHQNRFLTFRGRITKRGVILTIADITSIKMSELVSLNSMLEGQEMERKRLSREIHDGIGPLLSTLKMSLSSIETDMKKMDEQIEVCFESAYELIDEISEDLRAISHNLLPKILLDFGLEEALDALRDKITTGKNIQLSVIFTGMGSRLDQVTELGIYRICQELINNTLKHAKATHISLQLIRSVKSLRILYEDNGLGFSYEKVSKGLGLINIENRVKALGGDWMIDSVPGKGMTTTIEIPLIMNHDGEN